MTLGQNFWRQALERAIKTAAQAALLVLGADTVNLVNGVDFLALAGFSGGGFVISILTSIVTADIGQKNDPSAVEKTTS